MSMSVDIVNVGYDSTNYFVLSSKTGESLLIDCGWPGTVGKLKAQVSRKGLRFPRHRRRDRRDTGPLPGQRLAGAG